MTELEKMIFDVTNPICEKWQVELLEVNFKKQKTGDILEIIIDKTDGVSIDDCTNVNQELSDWLDQTDPIPGFYTLEVSSAGCEREIKNDKDLEKAIGKYVHLKLYEKINIDKYQVKELEGDLVSYTDKELTIDVMVKTKKMNIIIERGKIAKIRHAIKF